MNLGVNFARTERLLHAHGYRNGICRAKGKPEFVFSVSTEAQFTRDHLLAMARHMDAESNVGVVGTSFEGRLDGNSVALGASYRHPRNTGMLIAMRAFEQYLGGFNAMCDLYGGQEDLDFVLGMRTLTHLGFKMLDLKVPLIVGTNHDQAAKEKRELAAMQTIILDWRTRFGGESGERQRLESMLRDMRLT